MPDGDIGDLLPVASIDALRSGYVREEVIQLLEKEAPTIYAPAQQYFSSIVNTFYRNDPTDSKGVRQGLDIQDRQRCVLALQTAQAEPLTLAIHIYISLMEEISVHEVAHILLLAGVYMGVPRFFVALRSLELTLTVLATLAGAKRYGPRTDVLPAFYKAFGAAPQAPELDYSVGAAGALRRTF